MVDVLAGLLGALVVVNLLGGACFRVGAFEVGMEIRLPARPETRVVLPPVGKLAATSHAAPVRLEFTLVNIDLDRLLELIRGEDEGGSRELLGALREEIRPRLWHYGVRVLVLAGLGGAGAMLVLRRRQAWPYLRAVIAGVAFVGTVLGWAALTFNQAAFAAPRYEGALRYAPWVVTLAQEAAGDLARLNRQMQVMGQNFAELSRRLRRLEEAAPLEGALKVLLISDLHNNPTAYGLIGEVASGFEVQAIIDTGDVTDYGTRLEGSIVDRLGRFGVRYYFVPGNHDSPAVIEEMARLPGVRVLTADLVSIEGLRVLGFADPAALRAETVKNAGGDLARAAEELDRLVQAQGRPPEAVAVHNPAMAEALAGKVPVVLFGHTHRQEIAVRKGTLFISAGSTGAEGVRGLLGTEPGVYSLAVLYWKSQGSGWYLAGVDWLRVPAGEHRLVLERQILSAPEREPAVPAAGESNG